MGFSEVYRLDRYVVCAFIFMTQLKCIFFRHTISCDKCLVGIGSGSEVQRGSSVKLSKEMT